MNGPENFAVKKYHQLGSRLYTDVSYKINYNSCWDRLKRLIQQLLKTQLIHQWTLRFVIEVILSKSHKMITEFEIDFELLFYNFESKTKASNLIHFAKIGNHWSKMVKNGQKQSKWSKWSKMVQNGSKWSKMVQNGLKWPNMV